MATVSWKSGVSADWSVAADWTPAGAPNSAATDVVIAIARSYTVSIAAAESFVADSVTLNAASAALQVDGTLALGGTLALLTVASGTLKLGGTGNTAGGSGTISGGTISLQGGNLTDLGAGTITGTLIATSSGTIAIASGQSLTLSGATTLGGATITGPGTLATTGTTTVASGVTYLDGSLTWTNSGTVNDGGYTVANYPSQKGTVQVINSASGVFNLTSDAYLLNPYGSGGATFTNAGTLAKTGGTATSNVYAAVTSTGTINVASGTLELDAGGSLSGALTGAGTLAFGSGTTTVAAGTSLGVAGLLVDGGTLSFGATTPAVAGAFTLSSGTVSIANGQTLTLAGADTFNGGYITGPGTLATTGTTTIANTTTYLDGSLTWTNSGTVNDGGYTYANYPSQTGTVQVVNSASGVFNLTSDAYLLYPYGSGGATFTNAGTLAKTGGTGISYVLAAVTSTGTVTATSGTLELDGGGVLQGTLGASGTGALALGGGTFTVGAATQGISGAIFLNGGTVSIAATKTLTLSGAATFGGATITGLGTLATTGTTTIATTTYLDGSLTWTNSGTVNDGGYTYANYPSQTGTVQVVNSASGVFNLTSDAYLLYPYYPYGSGGATFTNAGTLAKTGGTGISYVLAAVTSTGTINVASGTLELGAGGSLSGALTGAGTLVFGGGTTTVAAGTSLGVAGLFMNGGTLSFGATTPAVAGAFTFNNGTVSIANGQTLTLAGADTFSGGYITGPGTLATSGTTTVATTTYLDGSLTWTNSGTVSDSATIYADYPSQTGTVQIINTASGVFNLTSDNTPFYTGYGSITFTNAGTLAKTGGTATNNVYAAVTSTGTITASTGTLELDAASTLGGTVGGTGKGLVFLNGSVAFATTAILAVLDDGTASGLKLGAGTTWTDSGTINDSGRITLGTNTSTAATLAIVAGAQFNLVTNDATLAGGGLYKVINAGTIAKTGGSGTSLLGVGVTNTGLIDGAFGTLKITGGLAGTGVVRIEAGDTVEIATSNVVNSNTIAFNGAGATLKLDANFAVTKPLSGFGAGDRIDLAAAASATAVINGNTLTITPGGGTALNFVSATSLAAYHAQVTGDGGSGSLVSLYRPASPSIHTPEPVAFGNHHTGDAATIALILANLATADGYSEKLDAALTTSATGFTTSGTITGLAAGATDSSSLKVTLSTAAAGTIAGTGLIALASDGTGVDGLGQTTLATQTVNVSGAVYAYAAPSLSATTISLGAARVGDAALSGGVTLSNGTTTSAYQENLVYGVGTLPTALSVSNGSGTVTSGGSVAIGVSLGTGTAGDFTGTAAPVALTSTGAGTSGLADTVLAGQTLTVNGKVYATAVAQLSASTVNFGIVHVGDTVAAQLLALTNAGAGALVDVLTGGGVAYGGSYAGPVSLSLGSGLAAGASTQVGLGLATGVSGSQSGSVVLSFNSHDSDLADVAANSATIAVTGTVDAYAAAQFELISGGTLTGSGSNFVINLGTLGLNSAAVTLKLGVKNSASGLSDLLSGGFTLSNTTAFNNNGFTSFAGLGAGQDEQLQTITFSTANTGTFSETIVLTPTGSNSGGYSAALGTETLTVTGVVAGTTGQTYTLTRAPVTITAGTGNDTFVATGGVLNSRDKLDGGAGSNTLVLSGPGVFDLGAPKTLANIQIVQASEGQVASGGLPDTTQTIYLRDGLNVTLNVAASTPASGNTNPETITIYGGADSSIINLASGSDVVVLGSATEKVNTNGGSALVQAAIGFAGAAVQGTGATTLEITNGGTATLNALTGKGATAAAPFTVKIDAASVLTLNSVQFITATGQAAGNTITAKAVNQTIGGVAGGDTLVGWTGFGDTFQGSSAGLNGDLIKNLGGTKTLVDKIDVTDLSFANATKTYTPGTGQGVLALTDGTHTTSLTLAGTFTATRFQLSDDLHGGTIVKYV